MPCAYVGESALKKKKMLNKRDIINWLFVVSSPLSGIGTYVAVSNRPSVGLFVSVSAHLLIVLFYLIERYDKMVDHSIATFY